MSGASAAGSLLTTTTHPHDSGSNHTVTVAYNLDGTPATRTDQRGTVEKEHQEHLGAVTANTLYVKYACDESATSGVFTKGLRLKTVRYAYDPYGQAQILAGAKDLSGAKATEWTERRKA